MAESAFDFLAQCNRDLLDPILRAEHYVYDDPVTSLFRTRQFVEFLVFKRLLNAPSMSQRLLQKDEKLRDAIRKLAASGRLCGDDFAFLEDVRQLGNDAVHQNRGSESAALRALARCYALAVKHLAPQTMGPTKVRPSYRYPPRPTSRPAKHIRPGLRAWVIRPYPHYQDCREVFRTKRLIAIGWHRLGGFAHLTVEQLRDHLETTFPENRSRWDRDLETILLFRDTMQVNDLVVMAPYHRDDDTVAIGQVATAYRYRPASQPDQVVCAQQRGVVWHSLQEPRQQIPDAVQRSIRKLTLVETDVHDLLEFCEHRGFKLRLESHEVARSARRG
jgi:hypothetical protein